MARKSARKSSLREAYGISQLELANLLKVSKQMITMMECKKRNSPNKNREIYLYLITNAAKKSPQTKISHKSVSAWKKGEKTKNKLEHRILECKVRLEFNKRKLSKMSEDFSYLNKSRDALSNLNIEEIQDPKQRENLHVWKKSLVAEREQKLKKYRFETQLNLQLAIARYKSELMVLENAIANLGSIEEQNFTQHS
jgi:transcriptional regulator with XRE-family HTH domain